MNAKAILGTSLVLNLVLVLALAWNIKSRRQDSGLPAADTTPSAAQSNSRPASPQAAPTESSHTESPPQTMFDWRMVESADYKKYIANLRSIGCPEETIRDIIVADVNKLFDARRRELFASTNKFEFWKTGNPLASFVDPARIEKQQALNQEKRALLKELLGVVPDEKPDLLAGFNPFETMLDFLPAGKQTQVTDIYMKYQAKLAGAIGSGSPDSEDMKNMQKIQQDMDGELAKVMTPEEYEGYQLRMSQTAMLMRMQLDSFKPTEQEFREIFKVRKAFDDEYSVFGLPTNSQEERAKRQAAEDEMKNSLKALLGDRYPAYERAQDYVFQSIYRTTERNGLPEDTAMKVYDMKKLAEEQAGKVRNDTSLTNEQRQEALRGIRNETENAIQTVLGDKAWNSFKDQPANYWLRGISPDPTAN